MKKTGIERRLYQRYDTEVKLHFHVKYDMETKVKFKILVSNHRGETTHIYSGISKNASVEGLCFVSRKKLRKGDLLFMEVFEPKVKGPVRMEGQVRWSCKLTGKAGEEGEYFTGVRIILVNNELVTDTIYFDKKYKIVWSAVLDSLFGKFSAALRKSRKV